MNGLSRNAIFSAFCPFWLCAFFLREQEALPFAALFCSCEIDAPGPIKKSLHHHASSTLFSFFVNRRLPLPSSNQVNAPRPQNNSHQDTQQMSSSSSRTRKSPRKKPTRSSRCLFCDHDDEHDEHPIQRGARRPKPTRKTSPEKSSPKPRRRRTSPPITRSSPSAPTRGGRKKSSPVGRPASKSPSPQTQISSSPRRRNLRILGDSEEPNALFDEFYPLQHETSPSPARSNFGRFSPAGFVPNDFASAPSSTSSSDSSRRTGNQRGEQTRESGAGVMETLPGRGRGRGGGGFRRGRGGNVGRNVGLGDEERTRIRAWLEANPEDCRELVTNWTRQERRDGALPYLKSEGLVEALASSRSRMVCDRVSPHLNQNQANRYRNDPGVNSVTGRPIRRGGFTWKVLRVAVDDRFPQ